MNVPEKLLYTSEHEWVKMEEGQKATVGMTAYAQEQLGDIAFIELPEVGKSVKQFDEICSIESIKAASDVYAPLSGKVVEVNKKLESSPQLINSSPYQDGWIVKIEISDPNEKDKLMNSIDYHAFLNRPEK